MMIARKSFPGGSNRLSETASLNRSFNISARQTDRRLSNEPPSANKSFGFQIRFPSLSVAEKSKRTWASQRKEVLRAATVVVVPRQSRHQVMALQDAGLGDEI